MSKDPLELLNNPEGADVLFVTATGDTIHAHSEILADRSKFWKSFLQNPKPDRIFQIIGDPESKDVLRISAKGINKDSLMIYLRYIYTNRVQVYGLENGNVISTYRLAKATDEFALRDKCVSYINRNLSYYNCLDMYRIGARLNDDLLKRMSLAFIASNSQKIFQRNRKFLKFLPPDLLPEFLEKVRNIFTPFQRTVLIYEIEGSLSKQEKLYRQFADSESLSYEDHKELKKMGIELPAISNDKNAPAGIESVNPLLKTEKGGDAIKDSEEELELSQKTLKLADSVSALRKEDAVTQNI